MTDIELGTVGIPPAQQEPIAGRDALGPLGAPAGEPLITFAEAATLVGPGVSPRTLRTWYDQGVLDAVKVGREWRTTATKVREAVDRLWQSSSSTVRTPSTAHASSRACGDTSGTSNGLKGDGAESVARAVSLATEMAREQRLGDSYSHSSGRPKAPVILLK
jgi:hypothetical protein